MNQELIKQLLVEIDGSTEKLRKALKDGEQQVAGFATKSQAAGKAAGAGADAIASKQANAARAIASATETIARQGKVSGEAAKQLISQASGVAFAFGPQGAIAGAIGIATLAIVSMFARTREEIAATRREAVEALNAFAEMDVNAQARAYQRTFTGTAFAPTLDDLFGDAQLDARGLRRALQDRGTNRLREERDRLTRERDALQRRPVRAFAEGGAEDAVALQEAERRLREVTAAYDALTQLQPRLLEQLQQSAVRAAEATLWTLRQKEATKGLTEEEKKRKAALETMERESAQVGEKTAALAIEWSATAASRAAAAFDELIAKARELAAKGMDVDANVRRAEALERLRDRAVAAAESMAAAEAAIARVELRKASGSQLGVQESTALSLEIGRLERYIKTLKAGTAAYEEQTAKLKQLLELRKQIAPATPGEETTPAPEVRDFADVAREIQQAADGALQLAQNLGGAADNATALLRAVGQVVGNLPALHRALNPGKDANGVAKPVSTLSVVSAALPILGALTSFGSVFGPSPEDRQRTQELRENTKALRELTAKAGLLGGVDVEGAAALRVRAGIDRLLSSISIDLLMDPRASAKRLGLDMDELDRVAKAHRITLNDSIESWRQLQRALADTITKLGEFGDDLDSQRRQADAEIDILGITDPAQQLAVRLGAFRGRSPALDRVLAGFDPNSAESRQAARQAAIELFNVLRSGGDRLGAGELGGLTGDDLLEALRQLIGGLDAIENAAGAATGSNGGTVSGFRSLTEATGSQLVDYARAAQQTRLQILAAVLRLAGQPIPVPALPSSFAALPGAGEARATAITIGPVHIAVHLHFPEVSDAAGVGEGARLGVRRGVEEALYEAVVRASRAAGDLRIYPGLG